MTSRRARDAISQERAKELLSLVRGYLPCKPKNVDGDSHPDHWSVIGPALIARTAGTVEAIFALLPLRRDVDAFCLVRSLYEHTVTFAWLAAHPTEDRINCWKKSDAKSRLKTHNDWRKKLDIQLLTKESREQLEAIKAKHSMPPNMPNLGERTKKADEHWKDRISALRGNTMSFRSMYAILYRGASQFLHPTLRGLNPVVSEDADGVRTIDLERPSNRHGPFGIAWKLFGLALSMAAESIGWPTRDEVEEIVGALADHAVTTEQ